MTETKEGREKIIYFIERTNKNISDMAVMFGVSKQRLGQVLNGEAQGPAANELILTIINAFKIR
ncbi:XRE family transcriptional regulator [Vagococcus salmoninarum]|uniref:XRE family transcriptional regulator n=1 Tax=Vagococcus salmoninarum TaxID=2739 RepID=UPI0018819AD6|nr:XRE family transcriptional regulator [Vagococcus salmoninarum]MBE9390130.1 XRE family transcriptional regulator [Vagococcus salmoninarum]